MKTTRLLAVLIALPLVAFDCGGVDETIPWDPFGFGCTLHVGGGAPAQDMWCFVTAYDYSAFPDPQLASTTWVFEIAAYGAGVGAGTVGGGVFLEGRPTIGATYSWSGNTASPAIVSGGLNRYDGSMTLTHANHSLGDGSGEGTFSVKFTQIPPADAVDAELLGVHGTLSATLPSQAGGAAATISARF